MGISKRSLAGVLGTVALAGVLAAGGLAWSLGAGAASFEPGTARGAANRALAKLRTFAPAAAQALEQRIAETEAVAREPGTSTPGRDDAAMAWSATLAAARRDLLAAFAGAATEAAAAQRAVTAAEAAVARAERQYRAPGLGLPAARTMARARYNLAAARALAADGALTAARQAALRAVGEAAHVDVLWQDLHARFEDPGLLAGWSAQVRSAIEHSRRTRSVVVVVDKLARSLEIYRAGQRVADFPAELGARGLVRKVHAGDRATPEGTYRVVEVKQRGATRFYKALLLDYPNRDDRRRFAAARQRGQLAGVAIGGLIEVHGEGGRGVDWTDGCIALTNDAMDHLVRNVEVGTPVVIVGARTDRARAR